MFFRSPAPAALPFFFAPVAMRYKTYCHLLAMRGNWSAKEVQPDSMIWAEAMGMHDAGCATEFVRVENESAEALMFGKGCEVYTTIAPSYLTPVPPLCGYRVAGVEYWRYSCTYSKTRASDPERKKNDLIRAGLFQSI